LFDPVELQPSTDLPTAARESATPADATAAPARVVAPSSKTRSRIVQITAVVVLVIVLFVLWRFVGEKAATTRGARSGGEVVPVEVATVTQQDVPIQIKSIGNVEALSTVAVRSQVEGTLLRVGFVPGQEVKKGDLLFAIDPRPLQAQLSQAEANLLKAMAAVRQGNDIVARDEATLTNDRIIVNRDLKLIEAGVNVVEIDLVRAGDTFSMLMPFVVPPKHRTTYRATVRRGNDPGQMELYPIDLRQRLPLLPIPLRPSDSPVTLDLQGLVDQAYRNGRYDRTTDYSKPCDPQLIEQDLEWANQLLRGAGRSQ
jgi:hypothetical protein